MPKQLALLFCTGFVFYLLWLERKQSRGVSTALWIPTLWMMIAASRPVASWIGDGNADSGAVSNQRVLLGLLAAGMLVLNRRRLNWSAVISNNVWLVVLLSYMLVSCAWTETPGTSFKRWIREFQVLIMALIVLSDPSPRAAMQSVLRRTVYVLIPFSLLLIKYFPDFGVAYGRWSGAYMWVGVTLQKNGLGRLCLIALFFIVWTLVRRWQGRDVAFDKHQTPFDVGLAILTVWLLKGPTIQAFSANAVISLSAGLAVFAVLLWMRRRRSFAGRGVFMLIVTLSMGYGIAVPFIKGGAHETDSSSQRRLAYLDRDSSFTGRTEIWAGLLPDVEDSLILGSGYDSFWTPAAIAIHDIGEAHNGYLDLLLNLGVLGLLLAIIFLLSCCRKALAAIPLDSDWGSLLLCFILMLAVHSIAESSVNCLYNPLSAIVIFLSVLFPATVCCEQESESGKDSHQGGSPALR